MITTDDIRTESGVLICPRCGDRNLHHGRVTVFDRAEDSSHTDVSTVVDGVSTTHRMPSTEADNPSRRRDGLIIEFRCEICCDWDKFDSFLELRIAQHKGQTLLEWKFDQTDGVI